MAPCYDVGFEADGEEHVARVHGDEVPTDPETVAAIQAVCKAAHERLKKEQEHPLSVDTLGPIGRKARK